MPSAAARSGESRAPRSAKPNGERVDAARGRRAPSATTDQRERVVVRARRRAISGGQMPTRPFEPPVTRVPLERDRPDDLRESERQHREVHAGQAHAEPAEDERRERAPPTGASTNASGIGAPALTAIAAAYAPTPKYAAWPNDVMPPVPIRNCRLAANSAAIEDVGGEHDARSRRAASGSAIEQQRAAPRRSAHRAAPGARTSSRCSGSGVVIGAPGGLPRSPCGFTASTTAITTNSATSVSLGKAKRRRRRARRCRARCTAP